jgi:hypothetical protein
MVYPYEVPLAVQLQVQFDQFHLLLPLLVGAGFQ